MDIKTAAVFRPLLYPARYKGAHGGRGSGKSHFFAEYVVEECILVPGTRAICIREVQKSLKDSSKHLVEAKIADLGVGHLFDIRADRIITPGDGVILFVGMQDHTAESIKSLEGFRIAWVDEAQSLSARSLHLLDPTLRGQVINGVKHPSELWFSWNPTRQQDPIDSFFRKAASSENMICVQANWRDNVHIGTDDQIHIARLKELADYPERYPHTWEGEYAQAFEGAYFAKQIGEAKSSGRIRFVAQDPVLSLKAFFDIGGTGAKADLNSIWIVQFVADQIRVLDFIEGQSQPIGYYADIMRKRGYGRAEIILPHDGMHSDSHIVIGQTVETHWKDAGFSARSVSNQGAGAKMQRIEAVRRVFPMCVFNDAALTEDANGRKYSAVVEAGLQALGFYHEKRDPERKVGLGPEHDWSSHAADAFGLMAICYEPPRPKYVPLPRAAGGWMGS